MKGVHFSNGPKIGPLVSLPSYKSTDNCLTVTLQWYAYILIQIDITTCNPLSHYNETFPFILALSKHMAISWTLKNTSATTFTLRSNRERLPGDAPLPPGLMNIYSKKMAGKKGGKILLEYRHSRL